MTDLQKDGREQDSRRHRHITIDDVEFETMTYVDWFNHRRLHGEITDNPGYTTPAEFETAYYSQKPTALEAVTQ